MDNFFEYKRSEPDYYQILGCHPSCSTEQIISEYKNKARILHPDKQNTREAEELFKQLATAKHVLSDSEKRSSYDKWRNSGIAISFERWQRMGKDVHNSMHWTNRTSKDLPIAGEDECRQSGQSVASMPSRTVNTFRDHQYDNDLIRKFRNYEV